MAHLGSFQHLPLIKDLHGKYLVGVSPFNDCDLQVRQKLLVTRVRAQPV